LFCFDAASGYCVAYRPAAEGSSCGDGQVSSNTPFIKIKHSYFYRQLLEHNGF
jgi:hypothetical protein